MVRFSVDVCIFIQLPGGKLAKFPLTSKYVVYCGLVYSNEIAQWCCMNPVMVQAHPQIRREDMVGVEYNTT